MSREKSLKEIELHKDLALSKLSNYLDSILHTRPKNVDLISYWLEDYTTYLNKESSFNPSTLIKYRRGDIVKVNFGYRVSAELGGLHLAIVIDAKNSTKSDTLTIIPLKSYKDGKLTRYEVNIGNYIYEQLINKINKKLDSLEPEKPINIEDIEKAEEYHRDVINTLKMLSQINRLKEGSVVSVSQLTTVSKIRIYQPKNKNDLFYNIRLNKKTQKLVDDKIKELFLPDYNVGL